MTKAFIADVLQESCHITHVAAVTATNELLDRIIGCLERDGRFSIPGFGRFTVVTMKKRIGINPRTQERVSVPPGATVRFKASLVLKKAVAASAAKRGRRSAASASKGQQRGRVSAST